MSFSELIESLPKKIDPKTIRIGGFPDIVWVFGGPTSIETDKKFCSFRNVFLDKVHGAKHPLSAIVRIPENYQEWNVFGGYADLLEFERDAGYLAKATVIFCESAGAFAELGAFASDKHLAGTTVNGGANPRKSGGEEYSALPRRVGNTLRMC